MVAIPTLFPENCPDCGYELQKKVCLLVGEYDLASEYSVKKCKFHEDISDLRDGLVHGWADIYVEKGVLYVEHGVCSLEYRQGVCVIKTPRKVYNFYGEDARAILKEILEFIHPDIAIEEEDEGLTPSLWFRPEDYEDLAVE